VKTIQLPLDNETHARVKALAASLRQSLGDTIRQLITDALVRLQTQGVTP